MISLSKVIENRKLVLGRNERYLNFIRPYNKRGAIKVVDDKTLTKKILIKAGIPVPKLVKVIKSRSQLNDFDFSTLPKSFVIKPVKGVRGGGVAIIYNRGKDGRWIGSSNRRYSEDDLRSLIQDILDGRYSLFNEPDKVLIEERVRPHKVFKHYSYKGAPDVRVLIFNSIPVMSYVRLPTKESDGKANLDLGAIAAGIDMAVGKTTSSIIGKNTPIEYVPNTNLPLSGLKIPHWDKILRYACEASKVTKLGFGAVDFLIDQELGPVIVELNARPGLSIQLANDDGLRWRLKKASGIKVKTTERAVRLAKDLFGGEIEEEIESISGKEVIGLIVDVRLADIEGNYKQTIKAKIDTGADRTSIDEKIMKDLGYSDPIDYFTSFNYPTFSTMAEAQEVNDERKILLREGKIFNHPLIKKRSIVKSSSGFTLRPVIETKFTISDVELESEISVINRANLEYKMIIGKKDLNRFLIDPTKK